ncbi:MAG TPA: hypothetical protein DCO79_00550 [Spirochaeta sp.]|nr:hypothetical protein [Spirochaeta sp.]
MNKIIKITFVLIILSMIAFPVLAQRTGSLSGSGSSGSSTQNVNPTLTIKCNIRNAQVEIFNAYAKDTPTASGAAPFSAQLAKASYIVKVSASGYEEQQQTVNLNNSMTLNFNLDQSQPVQVGLTIQSNVRNAEVVITGGGINGQLVGSAPFTAQLAKGRYSISVSAAGFKMQTKQVNLNGTKNLSFNLEADTYNLTITSNVDDAKVFIKGGDINGQLTGNTDMTTMLPPGTYRVKVNAPQYFAEEKTVQFNGATTVDFQLRSRTGRLEVIIPNDILDYSLNNPAGRISIFDNGKEIDGTSVQLTPGQHTIRITSGAFASQQTVNVKAGESYRIELDFGFMLIKQ